MANTIVLSGKVLGGIVGPGGETTGYALSVGDLDTNTSGVKNASEFANKNCIVAGDFDEVTFPLRGRVRILRAREIAASAGGLSRNGLRSSAFLSGVLHMGVLRPGSEGGDSELVGVTPEIQIPTPEKYVGKTILAMGQFAPVQRVTLGLGFVFDVRDAKVIDPVAPFAERLASADAARVEVTGYSTALSFDEAFADAVRQLPPANAADWLRQVHVDDIFGEFGGLTGVARMGVKLSAVLPRSVAADARGGGGQPDPLGTKPKP